MFTGLIAGVGRLAAREARGGDARLTIEVGTLPFDDVQLGESIAVNGCCLTVVEFDAARFAIDASSETLALTTLGRLAIGARQLQAHITLSDETDYAASFCVVEKLAD